MASTADTLDITAAIIRDTLIRPTPVIMVTDTPIMTEVTGDVMAVITVDMAGGAAEAVIGMVVIGTGDMLAAVMETVMGAAADMVIGNVG